MRRLWRLVGRARLFGPVFYYDLTRTSRRNLFRVRASLIFLLLILFFVVHLIWLMRKWHRPWTDLFDPLVLTLQQRTAFTASFFYAFLGFQYVAALVLTPAYVAGEVCAEKERKTLDLLLAADLSGREIVLGLFAARLAHLVFLLAVGLPVLAILQFIGGIEPNLLLAGYAAVGLTVFSLGGLSMVHSLYARRPAQAVWRTYATAAVYLGISGLAWVTLLPGIDLGNFPSTDTWTSPVTVRDVAEWLNIGNAGGITAQLAEGVRAGKTVSEMLPAFLLRFAAFHAAIGLVCCGWTVLRLRARLSRPEVLPRGEALPRLRPPIGRAPLLWKELFTAGGPRPLILRWALGLVLAAVFVPFLHYFYIFGRVLHARPYDPLPVMLAPWLQRVTPFLGIFLLLQVALRAMGSISGERDRQALDSLLTTPLSDVRIVFAKALGSLLTGRGTWLCLAAIWLLAYLAGALDVRAAACWLGIWLICAAFFVAVGLWCSAAARTTVRAITATILVAGVFLSLSWLVARFFERDHLNSLEQFGFMPPVLLFHWPLAPTTGPDGLASLSRPDYRWIEAVLAVWVVVAIGLMLFVPRRFRKASSRMGGGRVAARPARIQTVGVRFSLRYRLSAVRNAPRFALYFLRKRWRPALPVFLPLAVVVAIYVYLDRAAERELRDAIAETDRLDPSWRVKWSGTSAKRIVDADNPIVTRIRAAWRPVLRPRARSFPGMPLMVPSMKLRLAPRHSRLLAPQLPELEEALREAHRIAETPSAPYPIVSLRFVLQSDEDDDAVGSLLEEETVWLAQHRGVETAVPSWHLLWKLAVSTVDGPDFEVFRIRRNQQENALRLLERVLSQGEVCAALLEGIQKRLEEERPSEFLLRVLRLDRRNFALLWDRPERFFKFFEFDPERSCRQSWRHQRALVLRTYNLLTETAKRQPELLVPQFEATLRNLPSKSFLAGQVLRSNFRRFQSLPQDTASTKMAVVMVALERYRQREGCWPEALSALNPDLLERIPLDPYTGHAMRYFRGSDGVTVYCRGPNGENAAGGPIINQEYAFCLWNVDKRRQPPK